MEIQDAELYDRLRKITLGKVDLPSQEIRDTFNDEFVLTDLKHDDFLEEARADPAMVEIFADEYAVVFRIYPEGAPR